MSSDIPPVQDALHAQQYHKQSSGDEQHSSGDEDTYYNKSKWNRNNRSRFPQRKASGSSSNNWRSNRDDPKTDNSSNSRNSKQAKNPFDSSGQITRCAICESVNHWASSCPDRTSSLSDKGTYVVHEIVLYTEPYVEKPEKEHMKEEHMQYLVAETWSSGLLDSGASRTVCGSSWLKEFVASLPDSQKSSVSYFKNDTYFKFGDGVRVHSTESVPFPACIGNQRVLIHADIAP